MKVSEVSDDMLKEAVSKSLSWGGVAKLLGFCKSQSTRGKLMSRASELGIPFGHFDPKEASVAAKRLYHDVEVSCPKCGTVYSTKSGGNNKRAFCSRKCANASMPLEARARAAKKLRETMRANKDLHIKAKPITKVSTKICPVCSNEFTHWTCMDRTYCSKKCYLDDKGGKFRKKAGGGYRKNSGHSKSGYFRGRWCQSSYELVYTVFCLDHGIEFARNEERFPYEKDGVKHFYLPDFIEGDALVEIKGYIDDSVSSKVSAIPEGRKFKMLTKAELSPYFAYVKEKYDKTPERVIELYDGHKPSHAYECGFCHQQFGRDKKLRRETNFCSCSCAMKYRWAHGDLKQPL